MPHQGYASINTAASDHRAGVVITGFQPLGGTLFDLSISAGFIDGREVLADTSVTVVTADADDYAGFLISEDGAGAFVVTATPDTDHATAALALAAAELLETPTGDTALFVGVNDDTTAVGALKTVHVKGKLPFALIAADESISL